jgi:hypothetical protein
MDVSKSFGTQQVLGHKLGSEADRIIKLLTLDPDCGRLRQRLPGERAALTNDADGTGRRQASQEIAATLNGLHRKPPL